MVQRKYDQTVPGCNFESSSLRFGAMKLKDVKCLVSQDVVKLRRQAMPQWPPDRMHITFQIILM